MRVVAIALELENAVDEMLEHARAGHRPVLRDVPDEHGRDPASLRNAKETCRSLPDLGDGAGRRSQLARVEGLDGVDHADVRRVALEGRADGLELRLGEDRDVVGAAEALRAQADLRDRFLARDEECSAAAAGNRAERREEQGRLADAGLAAEQHERSRDEATPEDAVELRHAGREPSRVVDANVAEPLRGSRRTGPLVAPSRPWSSSTSVPKAPHPGHLPSHRPVVAPHALQLNWTTTLATGTSYATGRTERVRIDNNELTRESVGRPILHV